MSLDPVISHVLSQVTGGVAKLAKVQAGHQKIGDPTLGFNRGQTLGDEHMAWSSLANKGGLMGSMVLGKQLNTMDVRIREVWVRIPVSTLTVYSVRASHLTSMSLLQHL